MLPEPQSNLELLQDRLFHGQQRIAVYEILSPSSPIDLL
jgi:hypothetical protein